MYKLIDRNTGKTIHFSNSLDVVQKFRAKYGFLFDQFAIVAYME